MQNSVAYRLPTGELVFVPAPSAAERLLHSDFLGFLTVFVVSLSALWVIGG